MKRVLVLLSTVAIALCLLPLMACAGNVGSVTLLVYMCGSNLESEYGIASHNLDELLASNLPANAHVIVQTGGSHAWQSNDIPADKICRWEVRNHQLERLDELDDASMGDSSTLADFVSYGTQTFSAQRTMLLLWDHGGGVLKGACYDERHNNDALSLPELSQALDQGLGDECLALVGFDACLMADYEVAQTCAPYADALLASQGVEVGEGWDYEALLRALTTQSDLKALGKDVCDAYLAKCARGGKDAAATLSLVDLTQFEELNRAFEDFSSYACTMADKPEGRLLITNAARHSTSFGTSKNNSRGNLVDLSSIASDLAEDAKDAEGNDGQVAQALSDALDSSVLYHACGSARPDARGLSVYYPVRYDGSEVKSYLELGAQTGWSVLIQKMYGEAPEHTLGLANAGYLAQDGTFHVTLAEESRGYASYIAAALTEVKADGSDGDAVSLNFDVQVDWDALDLMGMVRGTRFALDGHPLLALAVDSTKRTETYTSLISLNGSAEQFTFMRVDDEKGSHCEQVGIVSYDEELGIPDKNVRPLAPGDEIRIGGQTFTVGSEGAQVSEMPLEGDTYRYQIVVTDIFGNAIPSDIATYRRDGDGWRAVSVEDVDNSLA